MRKLTEAEQIAYLKSKRDKRGPLYGIISRKLRECLGRDIDFYLNPTRLKRKKTFRGTLRASDCKIAVVS